jgi:hypothetical protein
MEVLALIPRFTLRKLRGLVEPSGIPTIERIRLAAASKDRVPTLATGLSLPASAP